MTFPRAVAHVASLLLLSAWNPRSTTAQAIPGPPVVSPIRVSVEVPADEPPRPVPPTHWKRGALIGGLGATALFVGFVQASGCDCFVTALYYSPLVAIPGLFIGSLIGGLFPRE